MGIPDGKLGRPGPESSLNPAVCQLKEDRGRIRATIRTKVREKGSSSFKYLNLLVDSGNSVDTLMSMEYFTRLTNKGKEDIIPIKRKTNAKAANNAEMKFIGRPEQPIMVTFFSPNPEEKRVVNWIVRPLIVEDLCTDFLMSWPDMIRLKAAIRADTAQFTLHIDKKKPLDIPVGIIKKKRRLDIKVKRKFTIAALEEAIFTVIVPKGVRDEELLLEPDENLMRQTKLIMANSVDKVREGKQVHVRILNPNNTPVTFAKKKVIGKAVPFAEEPSPKCEAALLKEVKRVVKEKIKKRETGTGAQQLIKTKKPKNKKELFKRIWTELDFDNQEITLTKQEKLELVDIFMDVPDALALGPYDVGLVKGVECAIDTGDHPPISEKVRPMGKQKLKAFRDQVKRWFGQKVASWGSGPWSSALVVVSKDNGGLRFCADYRKLNKITKKDVRPVANLNEKIATLKGENKETPTLWASIDLSDAYHCVPIRKEDQDKAAIITPLGLIKMNRMAFGLCNAPAIYHQVTQILEEQLRKTHPEACKSTLMYFDDALIGGYGFQDLKDKLHAFLKVVAKVGCKVQPRKCKIGKKLKWLGHLLDENGISPDKGLVQTMMEWDFPQTNYDLEVRCGLINYFRKFVKNFASKTDAIFDLKKTTERWRKGNKKAQIDWHANPLCQQQWENVIKELTSPPVLAHPDWSENRQPFILTVDSSSKGVGAILSQRQWVKQEDGTKILTERPLQYASKKLNDAQKHYSAYKLELFGLISACAHWRYFLIDDKFIVRSDHKALKWLRETINKKLPVPLARWQEILNADYDFEFEWVPGSQMKGADALSRKKYKDGDNGIMADFIERDDPLWLQCNVDPETAATSESDEFWIPIMAKRQKRPDDGIIGAITRSKTKNKNPKQDDTQINDEEDDDDQPWPSPNQYQELDENGEEEDEDGLNFEPGKGPPMAKFETPEETWDTLVRGMPVVEEEDEDVEINLKPNIAYWWYEYIRQAQNLNLAISNIREHIESKRNWPKNAKEIKKLVEQQFQDQERFVDQDEKRLEIEESKSLLTKLLAERNRGSEFLVYRDKKSHKDPGIVMIKKKVENQTRRLLLIPPELSTTHIQMVHHGHGTFHRGIDQTIAACRKMFYFPNMEGLIQQYIKTCKQCLEGKKMPNQYNPELGRTSSLANPRLKKFALDIVEMPKGKYGFKYLLSCLDTSTRWVEAWPLRRATAKNIARIITEDIISRYGENLTFICDRGSSFMSQKLMEVVTKHGCHRYFGTAYHPDSLAVERHHRTLVSLVRILLIDKNLSKEHWPDQIPLALYTMRCTPDTDTHTSAFERVYGYPPATQINTFTGVNPDENIIEEEPTVVRTNVNETISPYSKKITEENTVMEQEDHIEHQGRKLTKQPGKDREYYVEVCSLAWQQEHHQTKKDDASEKKHHTNKGNLGKRTKNWIPIKNELVDYKRKIDPESIDSKKLARLWHGTYSVTDIKPGGKTVDIQAMAMNDHNEWVPATKKTKQVYIGLLRPTLTLAFRNRPKNNNLKPDWINNYEQRHQNKKSPKVINHTMTKNT